MQVKINKTFLLSCPQSPNYRQTVMDTEVKGFGVRITGQNKTFFIRKRMSRKDARWIKIGNFPDVSVQAARKKASKLLEELSLGTDPVAQLNAEKIKNTTLDQAFNRMLEVRKFKPKTESQYRGIIDKIFVRWKNLPLHEITPNMVIERFNEMNGLGNYAYANQSMRVLRSIFNFSMTLYRDETGMPIIMYNPVNILTNLKIWNRIDRRKTYIKPGDLPKWYQAVITEDDTTRDYMLLLWLTGLRLLEAASLKWSDFNVDNQTLTIRNTKNSDPLEIPVSNHLFELLKTRKKAAIDEYIFSSPSNTKSATGHLVEPKTMVKRIVDKSGVYFRVHDLRRGFTTACYTLNIDKITIKRLMNHRLPQDVTDKYIIIDIDHLRDPVEKINKYLLDNALNNYS